MAKYQPSHGKHSNPGRPSQPRNDQLSNGYRQQSPYETNGSGYRQQGQYASYRSSYQQTPPPKQKKKLNPLIVIIIIAVIAVGGYFGAKYVWHNFLNTGETKTDIVAGVEVEVTIPDGSYASETATILFDNDVIDNEKKFLNKIIDDGYDTKLKPGTYQLVTLMDYDDLVATLMEGPKFAGTKVTINEGLTIEKTAAIVASKTGILEEDFISEAYDPSKFTAEFPWLSNIETDSLEGFLYPKTYDVLDGATAHDVIAMMLSQFKNEMDDAGISIDGSGGHSLTELVIIGSLIEGETRFEEERPLVSSVIHNRLEQGIALQIDAAIIYALGDNYKGGGVTYDDLEVDSPYNVYKNPGLPPGPICSPCIESIAAAANPKDTEYLYYLVTSDTGNHSFFESYTDFLNAKNSR